MKHNSSPVRYVNSGSGEFKMPLVIKRAGGDWFRHEHLHFQLVGCFLKVNFFFFFFF